MKKTAGITKYEIHWQILRASLKSKGREFLVENLQKVLSYFNANKTQDRWERSLNYIEALIRGYKAASDNESIDMCVDVMSKFGEREILSVENFKVEGQEKAILEYSFDQRYHLYKDLFKYNKHFCSRRYRSKELESLTDQLYNSFNSEELDKISLSYSYEKIIGFRANYKNGTNDKKFFF